MHNTTKGLLQYSSVLFPGDTAWYHYLSRIWTTYKYASLISEYVHDIK